MIEYIEDLNVCKRVLYNIENKINQKVTNVQRGEKGLFCSLFNGKKIVIVADLISANNYKKQMSATGLKVEIVSSISDSPSVSKIIRKEKIYETISSIFNFVNGKTDTLIILADVLFQRFPRKNVLTLNKLDFETGKEYKFDEFIKQFIQMGYKRVERVSEKGEFAILGDALFVYPINKNNIFRVDFFDEEIEKINEICDENTNSVESLTILPTQLFFYNKRDKEKLCDLMLSAYNKTVLPPNEKNNLFTVVSDVIGKLDLENEENIISFLIPFIKKMEDDDEDINILGTVCDENTVIFIDEPTKVLDELFFVEKSNRETIENLIKTGELLMEHSEFFIKREKVFNGIKNSQITVFENLKSKENLFGAEEEITSNTLGERKFVYDYKSLATDMSFDLKSGYKVVLFAGSKTSAKAIREFLLDNHIFTTNIEDMDKNSAGIFITEEFLPLSASFIDESFVIIGTEDLVKKYAKEDFQVKNKKNAFYLPKIGDYVVHDIHGIGKITAIEKMKLTTFEKDYFVIEYKGGDKLYVPSEQANLISLYIGGEEEPKLNKIGGVEFAKVKERVIASVKKMAVDLLALYREREKLKGKVYPPKQPLEVEFENAFEYDETDDQLQAIEDVTKDMESGKIMERLICGDVGYGKTEVALRAAFKTICNGGQVALLCPTTILSEQHYQTAQKRMKDFFVQIASLNRFKTKQQQDEILNNLALGKIDFIIGTQRLLSKDVEFKNLELLILDEEQRFGVNDKEKIKELKKNVNVLTLSATPIPRTLHMSLTGIRDISIIETPPKNRIHVQTYVCPFSEELLVEATRKELARGGQTILVYNSVEKIEQFASRVRELIPEANVGVGHGQMGERMLESVVKKLYNHEYDIFIATTIVENGIDLPLANTLIVLEATNLGLAQLYQLRGRVGRSNRLAYAYFTYREEKSITETAMKRLEALSEFTELGSGFRIAMRDLEIRGAGNVLGKEQHGHLEKVGYELYSKLLLESVKELQGKKEEEKKEIKMDVTINAFIPDEFIKNDDERIKTYSNLSEIENQSMYSTFLDELEEAYGNIPKEVISLAKIAFAKNMAQKIGAKRVICNSKICQIELYKTENIINEKTAEAIQENKDFVVLKFEKLPIINFSLDGKTLEKKLDTIISFLILATN